MAIEARVERIASLQSSSDTTTTKRNIHGYIYIYLPKPFFFCKSALCKADRHAKNAHARTQGSKQWKASSESNLANRALRMSTMVTPSISSPDRRHQNQHPSIVTYTITRLAGRAKASTVPGPAAKSCCRRALPLPTAASGIRHWLASLRSEASASHL